MSVIIETIIYLVLMFGIVVSVASLCDTFKKENIELFKSENIVTIKNLSDNKNNIKVNIYVNSDDINTVIEEIEKDEIINNIANEINIYKTFDK